MGLGRWPSPFLARFDTPFDLAASRAVYSPLAESHKKDIRHPLPRSREKKDTVPERRGSRWSTRVPLAGVGTLHGRPRRSSMSYDQDRGRIPVVILSMYYFYVELVD
jgi:hypothetical protein